MRPSSRSSVALTPLALGTKDWFIERRKSTHSWSPRSAALTRIFFRKTSELSMGTTRPDLPPTATVSTGGWSNALAFVSASR